MSMKAAYDQIAEWYDEYITTGSQGDLFADLVIPSLLQLAGDVEGQRLLDLACGQGVVARELARRGAIVIGLDISAQLLEIANRHEQTEPLGITYIQDDAQELNSVAGAIFEGVVCNMALMDIPDVQATFQNVRRVLVPGGWFVLCVTHPCFQTPGSRWVGSSEGKVFRHVRDYFVEGFWRSDNPAGVRARVGAYHRTFSSYVNTLVDCGFAIERIVEPQASGQLAADVPGYQDVPAILLIRSRKV
jgi:ubiquinone/menaquinone biosynthesis C-methylase UbiE